MVLKIIAFEIVPGVPVTMTRVHVIGRHSVKKMS